MTTPGGQDSDVRDLPADLTGPVELKVRLRYRNARTFLGAHGVDLSAPQQTKTRSALEFFAGQLTDT